jgi:glyoxylase-like metal-dependent hydrolase (beta-lactamase superfamily II)
MGLPINEPSPTKSASTRTPCFTCSKLNSTTFVIVEDDKWSEIPFIYVKLYGQVVVLFDTGCGGAARDSKANLTSLRDFIETFPVADNNDQPLNPNSLDYLVVISHCHFDHIGMLRQFNCHHCRITHSHFLGAISQFTDSPKSTIVASSFDRSFIEGEGRLPVSSLCQFFGMDTPSYQVVKWATNGEFITHKGEDLGLQIFHAPGHTPDSIAMWDRNERFLFVGDTVYEWARISFPLEGDLVAYSETIRQLKELVQNWNQPSDAASVPPTPVRIACGHVTQSVDGAQFLDEVDTFLFYVLQEWVEPMQSERFRDVDMLSYEREDGKIGFTAPKRLFEDFRANASAMRDISQRQGAES